MVISGIIKGFIMIFINNPFLVIWLIALFIGKMYDWSYWQIAITGFISLILSLWWTGSIINK